MAGGRSPPEVLMHRNDFSFDLWDSPPDGDRLLAMGKDIATGDTHRRVGAVVAGEFQEALFGNSVDQLPNVCPILGGGAHGTGFDRGVQRTLPQIVRGKLGKCRSR